MIRYSPLDGMTLIGHKADGTEFSHSPMDPEYPKMEDTRSAQQAAIDANTLAKGGYLGALHRYQTDLDAGRPDPTPPAVPLMAVVSDEGAASMVPWSPALPLPVVPVTMPSSGGIKNLDAPYVPTAGETAIMKGLMSLSARLINIENLLKAKGGA